MKSHARRKKPTAKKHPKMEMPEDTEAPILFSADLPKSAPGKWKQVEPLRATVLIYAPEELAPALNWLSKKEFFGLLDPVTASKNGSSFQDGENGND